MPVRAMTAHQRGLDALARICSEATAALRQELRTLPDVPELAAGRIVEEAKVLSKAAAALGKHIETLPNTMQETDPDPTPPVDINAVTAFLERLRLAADGRICVSCGGVLDLE